VAHEELAAKLGLVITPCLSVKKRAAISGPVQGGKSTGGYDGAVTAEQVMR